MPNPHRMTEYDYMLQTYGVGLTEAKVEVNTQEFKRSYMKEPKGRGGWIFRMGRGKDAKEINFSGKFADARKAAVKKARELGVDEIFVLP